MSETYVKKESLMNWLDNEIKRTRHNICEANFASQLVHINNQYFLAGQVLILEGMYEALESCLIKETEIEENKND